MGFWFLVFLFFSCRFEWDFFERRFGCFLGTRDIMGIASARAGQGRAGHGKENGMVWYGRFMDGDIKGKKGGEQHKQKADSLEPSRKVFFLSC